MSYPNQETKGIHPGLWNQPYVTYDDLVQMFEHTEVLPIARSGQALLPGEISHYTGRSLALAGVRVEYHSDPRDGFALIEDLLDLTPAMICERINQRRGESCQGTGIGAQGDKRLREAIAVWIDPKPVFADHIRRRTMSLPELLWANK